MLDTVLVQPIDEYLITTRVLYDLLQLMQQRLAGQMHDRTCDYCRVALSLNPVPGDTRPGEGTPNAAATEQTIIHTRIEMAISP